MQLIVIFLNFAPPQIKMQDYDKENISIFFYVCYYTYSWQCQYDGRTCGLQEVEVKDANCDLGELFSQITLFLK